MTLAVSLFCIAASGCGLVILAWRDPLRLQFDARARPNGASRSGWNTGQRRLLGAAVLAPGAVLVAVGQWAAFAIWLGALAVSGWATARMVSPKRSASTSSQEKSMTVER